MELNRWKELVCVFLDHPWEKRSASLLGGIFASQLMSRYVCTRCGLERTEIETTITPWISWARKGGKRSGSVIDRIGAIVYGVDFAMRIDDEVNNKKPTINSERRKNGNPPLPGSGLLRCAECGEETNEIHNHEQ
jgi:hypothetical protein